MSGKVRAPNRLGSKWGGAHGKFFCASLTYRRDRTKKERGKREAFHEGILNTNFEPNLYADKLQAQSGPNARSWINGMSGERRYNRTKIRISVAKTDR